MVLFSRSVVSDFETPLDCRSPGFPVLHNLLELAQTHVHQVSDAIQPSRPLLSTSPLAFCLSQHQGEGQAYQNLWGAGMLLSFLSQRDRHEARAEITALGHPQGNRHSLQLGHITTEWFLVTVQFRGKTFA